MSITYATSLREKRTLLAKVTQEEASWSASVSVVEDQVLEAHGLQRSRWLWQRQRQMQPPIWRAQRQRRRGLLLRVSCGGRSLWRCHPRESRRCQESDVTQ